MYGYKAVLEAAGRGGTYEKGVILKTPRIHCRQRTRSGNWKGLTKLDLVVPCYMQKDHMNQFGALWCWECNWNDFENW